MLKIEMVSDGTLDDHDAIMDSLIRQGFDEIVIEEYEPPPSNYEGGKEPKARKKPKHG